MTNPNSNPLRITTDPVDFNATCETLCTTTKIMEKQISGLLKQVFSDLKYVSICLNDGIDKTIPGDVPMGELIVNLYFAPGEKLGEADVDAGMPYNSIVSVNGDTNKSSNDMLNAVRNVTGTHVNRVRNYTVNNTTRELLAPFMFNPNINWNMHITECEDNVGGYSNKRNYVVGVIGLSLGKIIDLIYGPKDENDEPVDYMVNVVRNIVPASFSGARQYLININRMSRAAVREVAEMTSTYTGSMSFGTAVR